MITVLIALIILLTALLIIERKKASKISYLPLKMVIEEIEWMIKEDKISEIAAITYLKILDAMSDMLCTRLNHRDALLAIQYNLIFLTYVLSKYTKDDLYTAYENLGV